jgi:hypothetical protein
MLRLKARRAEGYNGCQPILVHDGRSNTSHAPTALFPKESASPMPESTLNLRLDAAALGADSGNE